MTARWFRGEIFSCYVRPHTHERGEKFNFKIPRTQKECLVDRLATWINTIPEYNFPARFLDFSYIKQMWKETLSQRIVCSRPRLHEACNIFKELSTNSGPRYHCSWFTLLLEATDDRRKHILYLHKHILRIDVSWPDHVNIIFSGEGRKYPLMCLFTSLCGAQEVLLQLQVTYFVYKHLLDLIQLPNIQLFLNLRWTQNLIMN